jgi:hypothetical protein
MQILQAIDLTIIEMFDRPACGDSRTQRRVISNAFSDSFGAN